MSLYYHPRQLHTGEARVRPVAADEVLAADSYWAMASRAGCRVAAIDQPQTVPPPGLNGIQLCEWGLHDRNFAIASEPPDLLDQVCARHGEHPVRACDLHGEVEPGYRRLLDDLLRGVERKTDLLLDLLGREEWDLFTCTYGETHCAGHQFWDFWDGDGATIAAPELHDAIRTVYQGVDRGIAKLIAAAGGDTTVLVYTSHGMGPYLGGYQLLPEILVRLGLGSGSGRSRSGSLLRRLQTKVSYLPRPVQPLLRRVAAMPGVRDIEAATGCLIDPLESPRSRAAALRNNRCGAIRLNLRGREPFGSVAPGTEADRLIAELRHELHVLEHPMNGERIVERTVTAEETFGSNHHPDVPDIMVVFRTDLGRIEACRSERVGTVRVPIYHPNTPRSGDHTPHSRLWAVGPPIATQGRGERANVLDIAPTILRLLSVTPPANLDGRALLTPAASRAATQAAPAGEARTLTTG